MRAVTVLGGSGGMLSRKIFENLHFMMAILVLLEQVLRQIVQRWAFFKNWLKRSATKRKSSVKSRNATQLAQPNL